MTNSESAKRKAQENLRLDPMFYKRLGSRPKRFTTTPRGFGAMDPDLAKEIQAKGLAARKAKRDEQAK